MNSSEKLKKPNRDYKMKNNQENDSLQILYQDKNILAINKPAGLVVYNSKGEERKSLMNLLIKKFPNLKNVGQKPRYGLIHRLDKDTSGIILIAKNNKALEFFQKQFKEREITKKYLALVYGRIKDNAGDIKTLIGRAKKNREKQQVYLPSSPEGTRRGLREAETHWKIKKKFKKYTLLEITPKTGRKHQIRVHLAYIKHPVVGDKIYSFKNQLKTTNLSRQFLHCYYLKAKSFNNKTLKIKAGLPIELENIIKKLN